MIKYVPEDTSVCFMEIPDEVSLCINISNCQNNCIGCHSPYLKKDVGNELDFEALERMIKENDGITCVCFMGEGNDAETLKSLAKSIKRDHGGLKVAVYSGRESVEDEYFTIFDYVKVGPYIPKFGPLNRETTNQRLYFVEKNGIISDITEKFWKENTI